MRSDMSLQVEDHEKLGSLVDWLSGLPDVTVTSVAAPSQPNSQGSGWDALVVACGAGGAVTVAVRALTTWIESTVTRVRVRIGENELEITSRNAAELAPRIMAELTRAAEHDAD